MPRFGKRRAIHYPPRPRKRRFHYARPRFRRHRDRRISIIGTIGTVGSLWVPQNGGAGGEMSLGQWVTDFAMQKRPLNTENITYALGDTMGQYLGYNFKMNRWGIPMGTVTVLLAGLASKFAGKYANKYLKNLPVVGSRLKM